VAGAGWNARARLDVADHVQLEMPGEVGPRVVIGDNLAARIRPHLGIPVLLGSRQALVEVLKPLLEIARILGVQLRKFAGNALGDATAVVGIEPIVWVALRVYVSHGAGDLASGYL